MRGVVNKQQNLFSYVSIEDRIHKDHPLRAIKKLVGEVFVSMDSDFDSLYSDMGRSSIPPEQLLSALLLQVFFGIRSEIQLMEQMDYNLLYRWFVDLDMDGEVWDVSVFTKNRDRLINSEIGQLFLQRLLSHPDVIPLLSNDHFSVDGTLIEGWASHKSFQPKDGSGGDGQDFHGQKRKNDTHASVTDPDTRLYKKSKGKEAKLCYMGHALMENRNGLVVGTTVTHATGTAERDAAKELIKPKARKSKRITVGGDKNYDTRDHIKNLRAMNVTPHVSQNTKRKGGSAIDGRTTRHKGYSLSATIRKRIECVFGYGKQVGSLRKTKHRGLPSVGFDMAINAIGYNLTRIPKLLRLAAAC